MDRTSVSYVICYIDNDTGEKNFATILPDERSQWETDHPSCGITHMFKESANIIDYENSVQQKYGIHCQEYGLSQSDLGRQFVDHNGNTMELLGFQPKNRKYKFIMRDVATKRRFKVTDAYLKALTPVGGTP